MTTTADALAALPLPPGARVRRAVDEDADGLVALIGGVYGEYPGCVMDLDGVDADLQAWATHLSRRAGAGWVVVDEDGAAVACVGVAPSGDDEVELKRLYVGPAARRRGLGAALVALVEAWAAEHGAGGVQLWTDTRFHDAHRLYERSGYERTGAHRQLHDPSDTTEAQMRKHLPG